MKTEHADDPQFEGRIVCQFSCGAASAVATKLALAQHGAGVQIINAFLKNEHPDNRRFFADCERWMGRSFTVLRDQKYGADIVQVFRKKRFMNGPMGAPCSRELKRKVLDAWSRPGDIMVLGYTVEEEDRLDDFRERNQGRPVLAPLIDAGLSKEDCKAMVLRAGIELPYMYRPIVRLTHARSTHLDDDRTPGRAAIRGAACAVQGCGRGPHAGPGLQGRAGFHCVQMGAIQGVADAEGGGELAGMDGAGEGAGIMMAHQPKRSLYGDERLGLDRYHQGIIDRGECASCCDLHEPKGKHRDPAAGFDGRGRFGDRDSARLSQCDRQGAEGRGGQEVRARAWRVGEGEHYSQGGSA